MNPRPIRPATGHATAHRRRIAGVVVVCLVLGSCSTMGPSALRVNRMQYNEALQHTEQRELLLNLVRLRYLEPPEFLGVTSIATQVGLEASGSVGGEVDLDGDANLLFPGVSARYSDRPTLTFTPLRAPAFTRQLMVPLDLETLVLLVDYGWGLARVLRMTTEWINGFSNVTHREAPPSDHVDALAAFRSLAVQMGSLHAQGHLALGLVERRTRLSGPLAPSSTADAIQAIEAGLRLEHDDASGTDFLVRPARRGVLQLDAESPAAQSLVRDLRLVDGRGSYDVTPFGIEHRVDPSPGTADEPTTSLRIRTRSVLGTMAYLSQGVRIPAAHRAFGVVADTSNASPSPVADLLRVEVQRDRPTDRLAVAYRDHWFFVDDADLDSRRSLGLLHYLLRLNVAIGGGGPTPVLTLPVGR